MVKLTAGFSKLTLEQRFARELPVIDSMGRLIFDPIFAQASHMTPRCEMFHIIKGRVKLVLGGKSVEAAAGDTLLIPTECMHRDEFELERGLEVFMVFFSWKAEKDYFSLVTNALLQRIPPAVKVEVGRMFDRLCMDRSGDDETHRLLVRSRVLTILLFLLQECIRVRQRRRKHPRQLSGVQRRQSLMLRAKSFLEVHFHEPLTLNAIAQSLKVSPFYLSRVFSKESDFSLFAYLTALRMNRAKELLAQGVLNVNEVADAVGYDNSRYFAKIFRQHFGHAPISTVYRELDPFTRRAKEYPK
ncbi:MAG: AraC family transcriptional regulator [Verrucomicrobia bacterium]|nr:AraC family transcriptional regulator [Verrucomicrobiota bacterium]MCG2679238.1 AraC family transcriptional regulator [Kiritimatiellia bacterium]MBU4248632.1 AraC family transcriptional regulator [Verrucomicrobiota bacterium]MBU4290093.1 AraC family transcriptional regulator [Verrucomicrobiota bacterium]MBU4429791.1 AraC family transcriptional regulator [Verrucomicrobiota bacterium]